MSEPSMIDMMSETELREELKQVIEDVVRKRKQVEELTELLEDVKTGIDDPHLIERIDNEIKKVR